MVSGSDIALRVQDAVKQVGVVATFVIEAGSPTYSTAEGTVSARDPIEKTAYVSPPVAYTQSYGGVNSQFKEGISSLVLPARGLDFRPMIGMVVKTPSDEGTRVWSIVRIIVHQFQTTFVAYELEVTDGYPL